MPWTRLSQSDTNALFTAQRAADPFGLRLHLFFACAFLFLSGWPTTWVDWAGLCLIICFAIRMISHHKILGPLVWDPIARLTLAWAAWITLSRLWSFGTWHDWAADAGSLRYAVAIFVLFPVLDRRNTLLLFLALGLICGQFSQLIHFIGLQAHLPALTWHRDPNRISGWWDPVVAGSLLCAALGLYFGLGISPTVCIDEGNPHQRKAALARLIRPASLLLIPLTLLSLLATGTRGAWIAAAILCGIGILASVRARGANPRRPEPDSPSPPRPINTPRYLAIALILFIALAATTTLLLPKLRARFDAGYHEVARALEHRDYTTDTGQRLSMWIWATRAFQHNPLLGVGAGGYRPFAASFTPSPPHPLTPSSSLPLPHNHAHSFYLHTAATLGLPGLLLLFALLITPFTSPRPHPAILLALTGLALAGLFDTIHVNQQTANLLYILLALSLKLAPTPTATDPPRIHEPRTK